MEYTLNDIAKEYSCDIEEIFEMSHEEFIELLKEMKIPVIRRRKLTLQWRSGSSKQNNDEASNPDPCLVLAPCNNMLSSKNLHEAKQFSSQQSQKSIAQGIERENLKRGKKKRRLQRMLQIDCNQQELVSKTSRKIDDFTEKPKASKIVNGFILPEVSIVHSEDVDQCKELFNRVNKHDEIFVSNLLYVSMRLLKLTYQTNIAKYCNINNCYISYLVRGIKSDDKYIQIAGGKFILWCSNLQLSKTNIQNSKLNQNHWQHKENCALMIAIAKSMVLVSNKTKFYSEFLKLLPKSIRTEPSIRSRWNDMIKKCDDNIAQKIPPKVGRRPKSSRPKSSDPKSSCPKSSRPKSSRPKSSRPKSSDPKSSRPKLSDPKSSRPKSSDPKSSLPKLSDTFKQKCQLDSIKAATILLDCGVADVANEIHVPVSDLVHHLTNNFSSDIGSTLEHWLENVKISLTNWDHKYINSNRYSNFSHFENCCLMLTVVRYHSSSWSNRLNFFQQLTHSKQKRFSSVSLQKRWEKMQKENFTGLNSNVCGYCENEIDQGSEIFEKCKNRVELFNKTNPNNRYCSTKFCSIYCVENARPDLPCFDFKCKTVECNFTGSKEEVEAHAKLCGTKNDIKELIDETYEVRKYFYPIIKFSPTSFGRWITGVGKNSNAYQLIGIRLRKWYAETCSNVSNKTENVANAHNVTTSTINKGEYTLCKESQLKLPEFQSVKNCEEIFQNRQSLVSDIPSLAPFKNVAEQNAVVVRNVIPANERNVEVMYCSISKPSTSIVDNDKIIVSEPSTSFGSVDQNSVVVSHVEAIPIPSPISPIEASNHVEVYNTIEPPQKKLCTGFKNVNVRNVHWKDTSSNDEDVFCV